METDLQKYLSFMCEWESESEENIDSLIAEQYYFLYIENDGEFPVRAEFQELDNLALDYAEKAVREKLIDILIDAAGIEALFSFGLGMIIFVPLQIESIYERGRTSDAAGALHAKMNTIDSDIAARIGSNTDGFIKKYKANNNLIASKGINISAIECRTYLFQFMVEVHRRAGKLDTETFKRYAACARTVYDSDEIQKIYDAIKVLEQSGKKEEDVATFMLVLEGFNLPGNTLAETHIVRGFAVAHMIHNLEIDNDTIRTIALSNNILLDNVSGEALSAVNAMRQYAEGGLILFSVVDIVCAISCIVDIIEQTYKLVYAIEDDLTPKYVLFFKQVYDASQAYNAAISLKT